MNISALKSQLEVYLNTNITDIAIKWEDLNIYSLNSTTLDQTQIDALDTFIAPTLILISYKKELLGITDGYLNKAFLQISIYTKTNTGATARLELADRLSSLFRGKVIEDVTIESVELLNKFNVGEFTVLPIRFVAKLYSN